MLRSAPEEIYSIPRPQDSEHYVEMIKDSLRYSITSPRLEGDSEESFYDNEVVTESDHLC